MWLPPKGTEVHMLGQTDYRLAMMLLAEVWQPQPQNPKDAHTVLDDLRVLLGKEKA
jgi:hypothetical protein